MSKSRNHKWNDEYDDEESNTKAYRMSQRRNEKINKIRHRDELMSNNEVQEETR